MRSIIIITLFVIPIIWSQCDRTCNYDYFPNKNDWRQCLVDRAKDCRRQRERELTTKNENAPPVESFKAAGASRAWHQALSINPDKWFQKCCSMVSNVQPGCLKYCHYDKITKKDMLAMYYDRDCSSDAFGPVLFCAGADGEHTSCCRAQSIDTLTRAGSKCLELCDLRPGRSIFLGFDMFPCLDIVHLYSVCYQSHVERLIATGVISK